MMRMQKTRLFDRSRRRRFCITATPDSLSSMTAHQQPLILGTATSIATTVYAILKDLGKHDATFTRVSTYDPLYVLGGNLQEVSLDIFLFAQ